jgi:hypothetical protein
MALGRVDHLLEARAIALLDPAPPCDLSFGLAKPYRERVAHAFELGQTEHAGAAGRPDGPLDPLAGKGGGEQLAEPAFEQRDLATELGADSALDEGWRGGCGEGRRRWRHGGDRVPLKQLLGHP